ncbi:helix-turn-helix transcriptional regulator [Streptomyces sp. NPDC051079]|uniref:helix-turn-helix transcriptional regulator n=1 Tax=Streptomyces sp. NPDC051079 TaxID=3155043 RepID=UPI00344B06EB
MNSLAKFGPELRRRRLAAGMTLDGLAARVHYSKGQLSKVETGRQQPTPELARLCDGAVGAAGELAALVPYGPGVPRPSRRLVMAAGAGAALALGVPPSGAAEPVPPAGAAGAGGGMTPASPARAVGAADPAGTADAVGGPLLDGVQALFGEFRRLGQTAPAAFVLPSLAAQARALPSLARASGGRTARGLYVLASRYAEFTGWMAQESGDDGAALTWTDAAVRLAEAAGDRDLAAYALVRRGLIAFYSGDAKATVELVQGAQAGRLPARVRGLAAQREAQGHALGGDRDSCLRALDRARGLLDRAATAGADGLPVVGTTHVGDPVSMTTGWCLLDLGLPRQAAEALDREVALLPEHALRTRVRYGVRRALSHAVAGEVEHACAIALPLLAGGEALASATIRVDLQRLSRVLARHHRNPAVRALSPLLTAALHDTVHPTLVREAVPRV